MTSVLNRRDELPESVAEWFQALLIKSKDADESIEMPQEMHRQQVIRLPVASPRLPHVAPAVGYYRIAWGEFSISEDGNFITIGFQLGPKFGRGDVYRIASDSTQRLVLERVKPAWEVDRG